MKYIYILCLLFVGFSSSATEYYWKGGSGDYNDPNMWWLFSFNSGQTALQAPISTDNVHFGAAAFTAPGAIITVNSNANCHDMIWDNTIPLANTPQVTGANTIRLDIYGSIDLATNMDWQYRGTIRFRSIDTLEILQTRGHVLHTANLYFQGTDSTEFRLMSELNMGDFSISVYSGIQLNAGYLNANGFDMTINCMNIGRTTGVLDNSIGLNLNGSTVTLYRGWWVAVGLNKVHTFDLNNSHIHCIKGGTYWKLYWGTDFQYDTISTYNSSFRATKPLINHLYSYGFLQFYSSAQPIIENWTIGGNTPLIEFYYGNNWVTVENIYMPNECDKYVPIEKRANPSGTQKLIKKSINANLNLDKAILQGIDCDTTNNRTYTVTNGVDAGGNSQNWQFIVSNGLDMYFRATTNNLWSNPNNWEIWDGSNFLPNSSGCLPTPPDNVFFDNLSFTTSDTIVLVDSISYCHNMYWFDNVRLGSSILLQDDLKTFGSVRLSSNMATVVGSTTWNYPHTWNFYGKDPDTIITNGIEIQAAMNILPYSYYYLADNLTGFRLNGYPTSKVHAKNIEIRVAVMTLDSGYYDSVYVWLNAFSGGSNMDYQGTTTYEFDPANGVSQNYFYASGFFYHGHYRMPNVIVNKHFTPGGGPAAVTIEGDLIFKEGLYGGEVIYVTGTMPLYSGDIYVTAGYDYTFTTASTLTAADTLHAIGNCVETINWSAAAPITVSFGATDIQYNFIRGWNNTGSLITANNSIDGGANTNVDFPSSTGTTFYWRASSIDATDFEGDWNDPTHWTTNPNDLVGMNSCLPTIADTVIFDSLSRSVSSNGCTISSLAYCNTIISKTNILLNGNKHFYIANSIILEDLGTTWAHSGQLFLVGASTSSILHTNNIYINSSCIFIDNSLGSWNLMSEFQSKGGLVQYNGNFTTNGINLTIGGYHHHGGHFDFENSLITISTLSIPNTVGYYWVPWRQVAGTLNSTNSKIISYSQFHSGNENYAHVQLGDILCSSCNHSLYQSGTFGRLDILGNGTFRSNNTIDTLILHGGNFYYLYANTTQTLSSPYGVIEVADVGPGQFVNVESSIDGQKAYFHKEYGQAFCVDWIKVKDNEATKGTPIAPWITDHSMLQFETGENSDNIGGTATGIWAFDMPPILTVATAHAPTIDFCAGDTTIYVPITMTGTYPYSIIYSWTNIWGDTGLDTIVVVDDDSNVLTPFVYNLELHPYTTTTYSLDIAALRCGGRNFGAPITSVLAQLPKDTLVAQDRNGSCVLNNNSVWAHFVDEVEQKPMLSILDSTGITDNSALGLVDAQTNFDATIQYWNGKPYLPRHWKVDVANNGPGKVRLYFTQADLDKLETHTVDDNIDPATELILYKFDDTITVGSPTQIPYTVIPLAGRAADPFADITDVFAIEFDVASFSGFLLQPTDLATFPLDLLAFEAKNINNKAVELNWSIDNMVNVSHFEIERSADGINFETIGSITITPNNYYTYLDASPLNGQSYYRLKIVDEDTSFEYSPIQSVELSTNKLFEIAPNPITDNTLRVRIATEASTQLQLKVFNTLGQKVWQKEVTNTQDGINYYQLSMPKLATGQYILQVSDKQGKQQQQRFILKN
ncbi:MAG: T9SS type A sorting domain-containing protein [Aureispira sp.]|nr:T9SS type A sorting domain-containing protein [Aureispira sp.]